MAVRSIASGCFVWTMFPSGRRTSRDQCGMSPIAGDEQHAEGAYSAPGLHRIKALARCHRAVAAGHHGVRRCCGPRGEPEAVLPRSALLVQVPLSTRWFPDLERPGQGIVGTASARLQQRTDVLSAAWPSRRRPQAPIRRAPTRRHCCRCLHRRRIKRACRRIAGDRAACSM